MNWQKERRWKRFFVEDNHSRRQIWNTVFVRISGKKHTGHTGLIRRRDGLWTTKYVYKVVAKASTGASTLSKSLTTYKVTAPTNKSAVNSVSRKAVLTWTRNASASGYQVQYSLTSSFSGAKTVTITRNATLTTTVSSLTKGKTYYTRIRAYKTVGSPNRPGNYNWIIRISITA